MILRKNVAAQMSGVRLDEAVATLCETVSKSEARRIIDRGGCALNGAMVRVASRQVQAGDTIEVGVMEPGRFRELELAPEDLLFENSRLVAVNKPAGVNTQRTPYQLKGTLEYWIAEYFRRSGIKEPARVVHRLDRGTSGVMVFPKDRPSAAWLSSCFHDGAIDKTYLVMVCGLPGREAWEVDAPIGKIGPARYGIVPGGKNAKTRFRLVSAFGEWSLLEAVPLTGRTHQIRVHLSSCGLPIAGDSTYGGAVAPRMLLHCASLRFRDERGAEIVISAPLDNLFQAFMHEKH